MSPHRPERRPRGISRRHAGRRERATAAVSLQAGQPRQRIQIAREPGHAPAGAIRDLELRPVGQADIERLLGHPPGSLDPERIEALTYKDHPLFGIIPEAGAFERPDEALIRLAEQVARQGGAPDLVYFEGRWRCRHTSPQASCLGCSDRGGAQ